MGWNRIRVVLWAAAFALTSVGSLSAATKGSPAVVLSGTVSDGSGAGWPLYARIVATSASTEPIVGFSDPVTGAYSMNLFDGISYDVAVTAIGSGYAAGGGPVTAAGAPIVKNWTLRVNAAACVAPGYHATGFTPALSESFDAGVLPIGWEIQTTSGTPWQIAEGADPCGVFPGNETGGSGPYAILNSDCFSDFFDVDESSLVTPPVDLSGLPSAALRWANDFHYLNTFIDVADVDVSIDGGTTWTNVWEQTFPDSPGPNTQTVDISFAAGHSGVRARFHYTVYFGWWWQVDDVQIGQALCSPLPGGLVAGYVRDGNTGLGLVGATVTNLGDASSTTTVATGDPIGGEGFYSIFAPAGAQSFQASLAPYVATEGDTTVTAGQVSRLDVVLPAALLDASPRPVSVALAPGGSSDVPVSIGNSGGAPGSFQLLELNAPPSAPPALRKPSAAQLALSAAARARVPRSLWKAAAPRDVPPAPGAPVGVTPLVNAGNVLSSFPTNLVSGWGLIYDTDANNLWVSNPDDPIDGQNGDGLEYQFAPDGTPTGTTIDIHSTGGSWQGDGAYNSRTKTMWQVNVGGDNCIFELDPATNTVTGKKICGSPWTDTAERGLAYDEETDTYYIGGPNDATLYHIDSSGNVLDTGYVGIGTTGLAYNPTTHHLFVTAFASAPFDVWVVDTAHNYAFIGGIVVTEGGVPVAQGEVTALEADCQGHLWLMTVFSQKVYEIDSGEGTFCVNDIPWLTETPTSGTVAAGDATPVSFHFDASVLQPGLHQGQILFRQDTPYAVAPLPVNLTVLFNDVPLDAFAANYIYAAAGAGVMPGGLPTCAAGGFCPNGIVTRADMAGYIYRAVHGATAAPPVYAFSYHDVAFNDYNAFYIQGITNDGITAGCGSGDFCPTSVMTRAQMAVLLWKGQHGSDAPPACTGVFADVPCPDGFAADYIEGIYAEGVTAGCGNGDFCPAAPITNAQMAVFLVKTFGIPYLP
jgi:hypothetical protein